MILLYSIHGHGLGQVYKKTLRMPLFISRSFLRTGWVPKKVIKDHLGKLFILDFFGTKSLKNSLHIPLSRVLTPFGTPWNSFLGYYLSNPVSIDSKTKMNQGVIWGKDPKHYKGQKDVLIKIASKVNLMSTAQTRVYDIPGITWLGHQTPESWNELLRRSKFLLGLGDPLLGPSAVDAIAAGCMFINPVYDKPVRDIYNSQHDFASEYIGFPYVCSVKLNDLNGVMKCIEYALNNEIKPFVPDVLRREPYIKRVAAILGSV